ncbi:MAG: ribosome maturation factor RimM [Desulfobacterales bacterium]
MGKSSLLCLGRIIGVHGIRGGLKFLSYAESPDVFTAGRRVRLRDARGADAPFTLRETRLRRGGLVLYLEGVEDRTAAEGLVGRDLLVDRAELPPLPEGAYYWEDLIGLSVFEADGRLLGRLVSILPTGSNDVYVVRDARREILVPALAAVIREVDLVSGRMVVALPEGLP